MRNAPPSTAKLLCLLALPGSIVLTATCTPSESKQVDLDRIVVGQRADGLIDRVVEKYRNATSYRDHGTVIQFEENGEDEEYRKTFKTAFVRPDRFRFEWSEPWPMSGRVRRVVWSDGKETRTWWEIPLGRDLDEKDADLDMAIAGATGVSSGAANTIPSILMYGTVRGRTLKDLERSRVEREVVLDGRPAWVITGIFADHYLMRVYVDKKELVILQIDESRKEDHGTLDDRTTYSPEIGVAITDQELERGW